MNMDYYRTFLSVAKCKSATRAAKELYTSQPAVTRTIMNLERELGCTLFTRSKSGMELTHDGEILFEYASSAFSTLTRGEEIVSRSLSFAEEQISIGATITSLDEFLYDYLDRFHSLFPKARFKMFTSSSNQALQKLSSGQIEVAFITSPYREREGMERILLKEFENVVIAGPRFSHLKGRKLGFEELASLPFVLLGKHMQLREYVDDIFLSHDLFLEPTVEIDAAHLIMPMVRKNYGVGITPLSLVQEEIEKGGVFILDLEEPLPKREVYALIDKNRPLTRLGKEFIAHLKEE